MGYESSQRCPSHLAIDMTAWLLKLGKERRPGLLLTISPSAILKGYGKYWYPTLYPFGASVHDREKLIFTDFFKGTEKCMYQWLMLPHIKCKFCKEKKKKSLPFKKEIQLLMVVSITFQNFYIKRKLLANLVPWKI